MIVEDKVSNKKIVFKIVIALMLIICVIILAQLAWAKYMTKVEGEASADIAHFSFTVTEKSSNSLTIDLADTRLPNDTTSVAGTTVAPGTKGALAFDINANESDVYLKYDIDIDITEVPQNLIFYSDLGMTNAIYHSNNNININGFFSKNIEDKTETKVIYWYWPLETGQTEEQIDINDEIDSTSMGDLITVDIQVTGQQVSANSVANQYAITFDANGGVIPGYGNSQKVTKTVDYECYKEDAIIPTKTGYKFDGYYLSDEGYKNLTYRLHKFSGANTARFYLDSIVWTMSNADIGRHIQSKINITGNNLMSKPVLIEFNDLELLKNTEYYISGEPGNWNVYIDFDITEQMIVERQYGGGIYDYSTLRFIDIVGEYYNASDTIYTVDYLIIDNKRIYGDDGKLVLTEPLTENITVFANWVEE